MLLTGGKTKGQKKKVPAVGRGLLIPRANSGADSRVHLPDVTQGAVALPDVGSLLEGGVDENNDVNRGTCTLTHSHAAALVDPSLQQSEEEFTGEHPSGAVTYRDPIPPSRAKSTGSLRSNAQSGGMERPGSAASGVSDASTQPAEAQPVPSRIAWEDGNGGEKTEGVVVATIQDLKEMLTSLKKRLEGRTEAEVVVDLSKRVRRVEAACTSARQSRERTFTRLRNDRGASSRELRESREKFHFAMSQARDDISVLQRRVQDHEARAAAAVQAREEAVQAVEVERKIAHRRVAEAEAKATESASALVALEERMQGLERHSEKLRRAVHSAQEEKKCTSEQLEVTSQSLRELQSKLAAANQARATAVTEADASAQTAAQMQRDIDTLERKLQGQEAELSRYEAQADTAARNAERDQHQLGEHKASVARLEEELFSSKQRLEEMGALQGSIADLKAQLDAAREETVAEQQRCADRQQGVEAAEQALSAAHAAVEKAEAEAAASAQKLQVAEDSLRAAQQDAEAARLQAESTRDEVNKLKAEITAAEAQAASSAEGLTSRIEALQAAVEEANGRVEEKERAINSSKEQIMSLEQEKLQFMQQIVQAKVDACRLVDTEKTIVTLESTVSALQEQLDQAKQESQSQAAEASASKCALEDLSARYAGVSAEVGALSSALEAAEKERLQLQGSATLAQARIQGLERELDEAHSAFAPTADGHRIAELESLYAASTQREQQFQEEIAKLKSQLAETGAVANDGAHLRGVMSMQEEQLRESMEQVAALVSDLSASEDRHKEALALSESQRCRAEKAEGAAASLAAALGAARREAAGALRELLNSGGVTRIVSSGKGGAAVSSVSELLDNATVHAASMKEARGALHDAVALRQQFEAESP